MLKRCLSILLSLCILLATVPVLSVSAQNDEKLIYAECPEQLYLAEARVAEKPQSYALSDSFDAGLLETIKNALVEEKDTISIYNYSLQYTQVEALINAVMEKYPLEWQSGIH